MIAHELSKLDRLNGDNYDTWSRRILYVLIHEDLDDVINSAAPKFSEGSNDEQKSDNEKAMKLWKQNDKKVRSFILLHMEDNLIRIFEDHETAHNLWKAIKDTYDAIKNANVHLLLHNYITYKMKDDDNAMDHVHKMIVMAKDLAAAGVVLSESLQVAIVLNSLPQSLNMAVTALRLSRTIKLVTDLPIPLAIEQNIAKSKRKAATSEVAEAQDHTVRHKRKQFKRQHGQTPRGACYNCGKFGHFKINCPVEKNMQENGSKNTATTDVEEWCTDSHIE